MTRYLKFAANTNISLKENSAFQFAKLSALQIYKSQSIYTFIPKNACSTMRYSLALENGLIKNENHFDWIHNNNHTFSATLESLVTAKYTFVILRCPYARLASTFLDKFGSLKVEAYFFNKIVNRRKKSLKNLTFKQFVSDLVRLDIIRSDIHWRPQVDFLIYENYDDYFSMENFKIVGETLKGKVNFDVCDARKLSKHGIDSLQLTRENMDNSELSISQILDLKSQNKIIPPISLYTPDIIEQVKLIYKDDLDIYKDKFGDDNLMFK